MKKYSFLFLSFLFLSLSAFTQIRSKLSLQLRYHLEEVAENEMIPLLVEAERTNGIQELINSKGGEVRLQINQLYSIELPADQVIGFSESEMVKTIEFNQAPAHFLSDTMLIQTRADRVAQMAAPLRKKYTGKGVLLGVIDSGIEILHPDFQDSLGNTRILKIWDQRVAYDPSRPAANYNYGVEWDSSDINNNICTHDDNPAEFGHGSMVSGAAASNGLASGFFRGVAPEVNIVAVATDFTKSNWLQTVAEAVDYIYQIADSLDMPCVINASIGTYLGSHDGKDIAARMIDQMIKAKSGRALVAAAGNAAQFNFHLQHQPNQDTLFSWMEYESGLFTGQGGLYYQIWADTNDLNDLRFAFGADRVDNGYYEFRGRTSFDSIQQRINVIYHDSIMSFDNNKLADVFTFVEESQGRYLLEVALPQPDSSNYLFRLETTGQGKIDLWSAMGITGTSDIIQQNLPSVQQFPDMQKYVRADSLQTIVSSFTCLPSVITVGNYINRSTYVDVSGNNQQVNVRPGAISPNSSLGPNRNGYLKPDISSAGDYMFAAGRLATMASVIQSTPSRIAFDSLHMRNGGTSMAAPTVAGMVALYLEQCSAADHTQIKNDLLSTRRQDNFTPANPSPKWGVGKADAFAFLNKNNLQVPISSPLPDYCDGDTAFLSLPSSYISYRWTTGDTTSTSFLTRSDSVWAEVFDGSCFGRSDTAFVNFKAAPPKPTIIQTNDSLIILESGIYEWYRNNSLIPGANDSILVPLSSGNYFARFSTGNNCYTHSDTIPYSITGINNIEVENGYSLYPNPTEGKLFIQLIEPSNLLQLIDQKGKVIYSSLKLPAGQLIEVDMSHLVNGLYLLKLETEKAVYTEKILKW